jgi:hypothetical protein
MDSTNQGIIALRKRLIIPLCVATGGDVGAEKIGGADGRRSAASAC